MVKKMVERMGKVESIKLLVMPEPWYKYIMSKGVEGELPPLNFDVDDFLRSYQGMFPEYFSFYTFLIYIGKYKIIDGNHRLRAFQELGYESHTCQILGPYGKDKQLITFLQLQVLQQGYNFLNTFGTLRTTLVEIILTLQKVLPEFIKFPERSVCLYSLY